MVAVIIQSICFYRCFQRLFDDPINNILMFAALKCRLLRLIDAKCGRSLDD